MADPKVFIDFTFGLKSGEVQSISTEEGRDRIEDKGGLLMIETHPDAQTIETLEVVLSELSYQRTIQRTVEQ